MVITPPDHKLLRGDITTGSFPTACFACSDIQAGVSYTSHFDPPLTFSHSPRPGGQPFLAPIPPFPLNPGLDQLSLPLVVHPPWDYAFFLIHSAPTARLASEGYHHYTSLLIKSPRCPSSSPPITSNLQTSVHHLTTPGEASFTSHAFLSRSGLPC